MQNRTLTGTVAALGIFAAVGLLAALALSSVGPNLAHAQNAAGTVETDRAALTALYNSAGGGNWQNNTNWRSNEPLGTWYGVTTDANGRVTALNLSDNRLRATIPDSLGNLTNLTELTLSDNRLRGTIPASLGNLTNLTSLELRLNNFSGEIPASLGNLTNLTNLDLGENQLSGEIPDFAGQPHRT